MKDTNMSVTKYPGPLPAEPILLPTARWVVQGLAGGSAVGFANARTGKNTVRLHALACRLESDERGVRKMQRTVWACAGLQADRQPIELCAPATDTGLADGSLTTFIVDHMEQHGDVGAIVEEARRVLAPGGGLVMIGYGRPTTADPEIDVAAHMALQGPAINRDNLLSFLFSGGGATGLDFQLSLDNLAQCEANRRQLVAHLDRCATSVEVRPSLSKTARSILRETWPDGLIKNVTFTATILSAVMPGTAKEDALPPLRS